MPTYGSMSDLFSGQYYSSTTGDFNNYSVSWISGYTCRVKPLSKEEIEKQKQLEEDKKKYPLFFLNRE